MRRACWLSVWRALGTAEESLEVASRYFALGVLCKQQGMYAEAATHYERILAIGLKVCAPRSISMSLKHGRTMHHHQHHLHLS